MKFWKKKLLIFFFNFAKFLKHFDEVFKNTWLHFERNMTKFERNLTKFKKKILRNF